MIWCWFKYALLESSHILLTSIRSVTRIVLETADLVNKSYFASLIQLIKNSPEAIRNRYKCDTITSTNILLRCLSISCRWAELNFVFRIHDSALVEIFYKNLNFFIWYLYGTYFRVSNWLHTIISKSCIQHHSKKENMLDQCIGFFYGTKIRIDRTSGLKSRERCKVYIKGFIAYLDKLQPHLIV